jgi:hypothetical protein
VVALYFRRAVVQPAFLDPLTAAAGFPPVLGPRTAEALNEYANRP